jgi:hypothetical protein
MDGAWTARISIDGSGVNPGLGRVDCSVAPRHIYATVGRRECEIPPNSLGRPMDRVFRTPSICDSAECAEKCPVCPCIS